MQPLRRLSASGQTDRCCNVHASPSYDTPLHRAIEPEVKRRTFLKVVCAVPGGIAQVVLAPSAAARVVQGKLPSILFDALLETDVSPRIGDAAVAVYTRRTRAMVLDHMHVLRPARVGEARFFGARRIENLLFSTIDYAAYAGSANFTIRPGLDDPRGGGNASEITSIISDAALYVLCPAIPGHRYVNAISLRSRGGPTVVHMLEPDSSDWRILSIGRLWQRFSLGPRPAERNAAIGIRLARVRDSVDIAFPQIEDVTGYDEGGQVPAEYVSVGVLSSPYHGAFVDGVKYFRTRNGNRVDLKTGVVHEVYGEAIPQAALKGIVLEGLRRNFCRNYNLNPVDLRGLTVTGGKLDLVDDREALFPAADLNPYAITPYPELRAVASGMVFRFVNNTRAEQRVSIAGATATGVHSAFVYARSTDPRATVRLGSAHAAITTAGIYDNDGKVYRKFTVEGVDTAAGMCVEIAIPRGATVYFIGNQLETGPFCSTLIEVAGRSASRDDDFLAFPTIRNFNSRSGTALLTWSRPYATRGTKTAKSVVLASVSGAGVPEPLVYEQTGQLCSAEGPSAIRQDMDPEKGAVLKIGITWNKVGALRQYLNGKMSVAGPSGRSLQPGSTLVLGNGGAFGAFKRLVLYGGDIGPNEVIGRLMTVNRARIIFDDSPHQEFYKSEAACDAYVERLRYAGFNVVFPYVWDGNGTRYLNTLGVPIDYRVAQYFRRGFDGLAYLIRRCHSVGIEVHPVFSVVKRGWAKSMRPYDVYFDNPHLAPKGHNTFYNIHMLHFRRWISDIMLNFVSRYEIDGLCFDYLRAGPGFYASTFNISDYLTSFDRDLATDIVLGPDAPGVKLREWNKRDIEDILGLTVPGTRALRPRAIASNAGIGQCNPIRGSSGTEIQGQYNINWVNSGLIDYVIPWDYAHPIPAADWTYKNALSDRRRGTVMGGLYHGRKPAEPVLLESIMPAILADDGDMAALYPYWKMSDKQVRLLRSRYFQLPARIPWRAPDWK